MPKNANAQVMTMPSDGLWSGRTLAGVAGAIVIVLAAAYLTGAIGDGVLGIAIAAVAGLVITGRVAATLLESAGSIVMRGIIVVVLLPMLALSVLPVVLAILPGSPVATGALSQPGDTIALPEGAGGRLRLLVHGGLGSQGAATVTFELTGPTEPLSGTLERSVSTARIGRSGSATQMHERTSEYLDALMPGAQHSLKLDHLDGPLAGSLDVRVYPDRIPLIVGVLLGGLLLAIVALLAARLQVGSDTVVAAGLAVAFGAFGHQWVTPDSVIRPIIGALIVGALAGGAAGGILAWAARKVLPQRARGT